MFLIKIPRRLIADNYETMKLAFYRSKLVNYSAKE